MRKINLLFLVLFLSAVFGFLLVKEAKAGPEQNVYGWAWVGNTIGAGNPTLGWISMNCTNLGEYYAGTSVPIVPGELHGWAWSDNIGWISLNCDNDPGCDPVTEDYNVYINFDDTLSGYAWSDSLGWLSFNRAETGDPEEEPYSDPVEYDYIAKYDSDSKKFLGWGRFLSYDGWDGWIKLSCYGAECSIFDYSLMTYEYNLKGWSWGGEVVGWITFGGVCQGENYGVNIATSTGYFSGYAWARGTDLNTDGVGWISFNRKACSEASDNTGDVCIVDGDCPNGTCIDSAGTPPAPPYDGAETFIAKLDFSTKEVSGWARACGKDGGIFQCGGGGWDGWIKLRGSYGAGNYGVKLVGNEFEGWAWGGNLTDAISKGVLGWISFNDKNLTGSPGLIDYQVMTSLTFPPGVSNLRVSSGWDPCAGTAALHPTLAWDYSDGASDGYRVEIYNKGSLIYEYEVSGTLSIEHIPNYGADTFSTGTCSAVGDNGFHNSRCNLNFDKTYDWQVKAKDQSGIWSEWASSTFNTPPHRYPSPRFTFDNRMYNVDEVVEFTDQSICYDAEDNPYPGTSTNPETGNYNRYQWDFQNGETCDSAGNPACRGNVTTTFSRSGRYAVSLSITDDSLTSWPLGGKCTWQIPTDQRVRIGIPLPEWREIAPFSFSIKQSLARLIQRFKYWIS